MRVPAHRSPGSARHRVATLAARLPDYLGDIEHHISSRPLPSVTRAGIAASRLEPPWRASRRQPGEMGGIGPVDPALARDLARAAAANPETNWRVTVTVTDDQGHAIGHGCARPEPGNHTPPANHKKPAPPPGHEPPRGHDPPGQAGSPTGGDLPSLPRASPGHPAATAPGGSPPGSPGSGPCSSRWTRSPWRTATTGTRPRPRPRRQAQAPSPDPARHLHRPDLPPSLGPLRFRAQHPVRRRWPIVPVQ